MRFAIIGAGALGTIYAAHLARAGHDVQLAARGDRAARITHHGIAVSGRADFHSRCNVVTNPEALEATDVLIVAVKTYDTEPALDPLHKVKVRCAFSVQNGVRKDDSLVARWGENRVAGAISMLGGEVLTTHPDTPLGVRYDMAAPTVLGRLGSATPELPVEELAATLRAADLAASTSEDIRAVEWSKFVGWSGVSAVAVLTRLPTASFLSDPQTALIAARVMRETALIARALGVNVNASGMARAEVLEGSEQQAVAALLEQGAHMQANSPLFRQSILQDAGRGRPLEVDETLGYTLDQAKLLGIEVPTLDFCCRILRGISAAHRNAQA